MNVFVAQSGCSEQDRLSRRTRFFVTYIYNHRIPLLYRELSNSQQALLYRPVPIEAAERFQPVSMTNIVGEMLDEVHWTLQRSFGSRMSWTSFSFGILLPSTSLFLIGMQYLDGFIVAAIWICDEG